MQREGFKTEDFSDRGQAGICSDWHSEQGLAMSMLFTINLLITSFVTTRTPSSTTEATVRFAVGFWMGGILHS